MVLTIFLDIVFAAPSNIEALTLRELSNQIAALTDEEEALIEEILTVEALIETKKNEIMQLSKTIVGLELKLRTLPGSA